MGIEHWLNTAKFALHPSNAFVMANKLLRKIRDKKGDLSYEENMEWIRQHCADFTSLAHEMDFKLYKEASDFEKKLSEKADIKLSAIDYSFGGGGFYKLLYFITRHLRPDVIVETGVAAGYSSQAFLEAIKLNGNGKLYSSDFPYFRLPNPERYIGILVDGNLKKNWNLYLDGDRKNLPLICSDVTHIGIFHYDSDKRYSGREFALSLIESKIDENSLIIMDDIQDNSFFHDYLAKNQIPSWHIFEFESKYIGMIGKL